MKIGTEGQAMRVLTPRADPRDCTPTAENLGNWRKPVKLRGDCSQCDFASCDRESVSASADQVAVCVFQIAGDCCLARGTNMITTNALGWIWLVSIKGNSHGAIVGI